MSVDASNAAPKPIGFVNGYEYLKLPRAPETWVVQDLLPAGGLCNIYGQPKFGKSFAALQMAYAISAGEPEWLGFPVKTHGPVFYLQLDTPRALWADRVEGMKAMGMDLSNLYFSDLELAPAPFDLGDQVTRAATKWLRDQIDLVKPVALFLDTTRESHRGDENASEHMQKVISALVLATKPTACVLISHSTKENLTIPAAVRDESLGDNRGSGYVAGRMDGIVKFTQKGFTYVSRTAEKRQVRASRLAGGWWKVDRDEFDLHLERVLQDEQLTSDRSKAKALSELSGRPVEACRSAIRRAVSRETTN